MTLRTSTITRSAPQVDDLLARMSLPEKAGLLFHPMIGIGPGGTLAAADPDAGLLAAEDLVLCRRINHVNLVGTASAEELARWHNHLQDLAASTRLGVPVTVSTDPRHARSANPNTAALAGAFSTWPEPAGLAAIGDPELVRRHADTVRREYLAVGIRAALHPQADVATDPRWPRVLGTFGEDPELVSRLTVAYLQGLQGPTLGPGSVAALVKHFPGGGPVRTGEDPHFRYGAEQAYPGGRLAAHLAPFVAAVRAGAAQVMLGYGLPVGTELPPVAFAFNHEVVTGLLRRQLGFDGVICADWGVLTDACFRGEHRPARAWGVEHLDPAQRLRTALHAGVDQFGGEARPDLVVDLVRTGQVTEDRVDESATRILAGKVRLGLFDHRYVDPEQAAQEVGNAAARADGLAAQRACVTLLHNAAPGGYARLPLAAGLRVYAEGPLRAALSPRWTVVTDPGQADVAVLRLAAPFERRTGPVEAYFHAGPLEHPPGALDRVLAIAERVPTVVDVYLDRPAVLTALVGRVAALLVSFGVEDAALIDVLAGQASPAGRLPFDLPRSQQAVLAGQPDTPFDDPDPLFRYGHGLTY
ncbi:glycoside hydrolase family 3 N-terminal domain-containing protein [Solwaraspora sp. WMMA2056]|uniref:glycoside hydrolase family 3 protein n=1 Tax=Solwaraspora sp. WMMA2056 TaxID=3015161 RepID=UPI00259B2EAF|nr:glycoside hydrolase family 3 N-terminal domain-containing protein [Solwaraspora sp. WMMA2056]WJK41393.1 glycoside hydrolase family 3 N-terminal domain-containing protein [Solwaraspora sp. WMMA2056]